MGFQSEAGSATAAAGRTRVSSTIKPRCDAARSSHPAHIHLPFPAHSRSSDLRQHQVSSKTISARARGDARVAASGRVSGVRRRALSGPVILGVPPRIRRVRPGRSWTRRATPPRFRRGRRQSRGSRRLNAFIYSGCPPTPRSPAGTVVRGKYQINPPFLSLFQLTHHTRRIRRQKQHQTKARCLPPERLHRSLPHLPRRSRRHGRGRRLRSLRWPWPWRRRRDGRPQSSRSPPARGFAASVTERR